MSNIYTILGQDTTPGYKKLLKELNRLIVKDTDMSYGMTSDYGRFVILTGKHEEESLVAISEHNMLFTELEARPIVCVDLRPYLNSRVKEVDTIKEMARDITTVEYKLLEAQYMLMFADHYDSSYNEVVLKANSMIFVNAIRGMYNIDNMSAARLQIVILHYILTQTREMNESAKVKLIKKNVFFEKLSEDDVDDILKDCEPHPENLDHLVENIKSVDVNDSLRNISSRHEVAIAMGALTNNIVMRKETLAMFASPAVAIALVYAHATNSFLKKTRLANVIKQTGRVFDIKGFLKQVEGVKHG